MIKKMVPWRDDAYDKIEVEKAVMNDPHLPGTILRLLAIHGPGGYARRFHPVLKRIDDGGPFILYEQAWAEWRAPRGYVENVAAGARDGGTMPFNRRYAHVSIHRLRRDAS